MISSPNSTHSTEMTVASPLSDQTRVNRNNQQNKNGNDISKSAPTGKKKIDPDTKRQRIEWDFSSIDDFDINIPNNKNTEDLSTETNGNGGNALSSWLLNLHGLCDDTVISPSPSLLALPVTEETFYEHLTKQERYNDLMNTFRRHFSLDQSEVTPDGATSVMAIANTSVMEISDERQVSPCASDVPSTSSSSSQRNTRKRRRSEFDAKFMRVMRIPEDQREPRSPVFPESLIKRHVPTAPSISMDDLNEMEEVRRINTVEREVHKLQILNSEPLRKRRRLNEDGKEETRNKSKRKGFVRRLSGFFGIGS